MKFTRHVVISAGVIAGLAVVAIIAWLLRDSLIQRLSNPLLKDYGVSIVDVSLDALATSDASISYLELQHEKGTTIVIEDLTLPFAATFRHSKEFLARKVSIITATRGEAEEFEIAELVRQVLSLPETLDDSVIIVDEFSLAPYPIVEDIRWEITDDRQHLNGTIESVVMSATAARRDPEHHDIAFSVRSAPAAVGGNTLSAVLTDEAARLTLSGRGLIDLPIWQAFADLVGIVPTGLEIASGTANLTFDIAIPNDPALSPTAAASLVPTSLLELTYQEGEGLVSVLVEAAGSADIMATFPNVDWSLTLGAALLKIGYGSWNDIPLSLNDLACNSGPTCSMRTHVNIEKAKLPIGSVAHAEFSATERLHFSEAGIQIDVEPGATLGIKGLVNGAGGVKRLQARLVSAAALELAEAGWRLTADSVDAEIEALSLGDAISISMPLFLENVGVAENDNALTLRSGVHVPSSQAAWGERTIVLPGIKGEVMLRGGDAAANLETVGLHQEAAIEARHSLADAVGHISVSGAAISLGKASLSDRISPWPGDRDIVAGTLGLDMSAGWVRKKSRLQFTGKASVVAEGLAGFYGDTALSGVSTELRTTYRDAAGFETEPSTITAALVDVGVPVENLSADIALDLDTLSADVGDLRMSAFGGAVTAEPFSFHTDRAVNTLILNAESLDLSELLSLKGFEAVDVTGSINVRLPLAIEGNTVTIVDGTLTGNPPGGVIRYRSESPPDALDTSSWDYVKRVLNNLEFETLTSGVNLSKEGDLIMQLQLKGRNPELDEHRPVVLNLRVENNIPQMLRSLRAARAVEDILEKRLSR